MNYSKEYLEKSESFANAVESDSLLMKKLEAGNLKPLSPEEDKILTDWVESGDPAVWEFMERFIKSEFFQEAVKNH